MSNSIKNRIFCSLGSALEWFDFALYGFFGEIFSKNFFSNNQKDRWETLIATYLVFAIGFIARPLGSLIFGYLGDKYGRIFSLRITPLLITMVTASMAFLPTYNSFGNSAILILVAIRISQGILIGGEFAGNIVYICESSKVWKYFWGSICSCTGSMGIIMASLAASLVYNFFNPVFAENYGWRIPFLFSIPLGIIIFLIRLKIPESPSFLNNFHIQQNPIIESFKHHKLIILLCLGLICLHATSFYFVFMFLPIFLNKIRHLSTSAALLKNTGFLILHLCFIPLFGLAVNLIGGLKSLIISGLIFMLISVPTFYFIVYGGEILVFISLLVFSVITSFNAAIIPGLFVEIIPAKIRYTVLATSFNLGFGLFGGATPFINLLMINKTSCIMLPSIYLITTALVTLISSYFAFKIGSKNDFK